MSYWEAITVAKTVKRKTVWFGQDHIFRGSVSSALRIPTVSRFTRSLTAFRSLKTRIMDFLPNVCLSCISQAIFPVLLGQLGKIYGSCV
jgi:hypothetical protein